MISIQGLTKVFGTQVAVDHLCLDVPPGQILGLLGPSGAGKTTTLKMVTGMLAPTTGTATICGIDIVRDPMGAKRLLGFVPDSGSIHESLTGLEYLLMVGALYGIGEPQARVRIRQFLDFFDLDEATLQAKLLGAYSKGMRRKIVITAALLHDPKVLLLDEPFDGLDASAAVGFEALLEMLARAGKTIVFSSHVLDVVERVCHRVAIVDQGKLLVDGAPLELVQQHGVPTLAALFTRLTGVASHEARADEFASNATPTGDERRPRWLLGLLRTWPLRRWLRDPLERHAFLLATASLVRDRAMKHVLLPTLVAQLPACLLVVRLEKRGVHNSAQVMFVNGLVLCCLLLVPSVSLVQLRRSLHGEAATIVRLAPTEHSARLFHGEQKATHVWLVVPALVFAAGYLSFVRGSWDSVLLALPLFVTLPIASLVPAMFADGWAMSKPNPGLRDAGMGCLVMAMFPASAVAVCGVSGWMLLKGWFWPFLAGVVVVGALLQWSISAGLRRRSWRTAEE